MIRATEVPAADRHETIVDLLRTSARSGQAAPLRRTFLQQGSQRTPSPGPLAGLVSAHDERALDLYLLHRAAASGGDWDVTRDARVWGRALGLGTDADGGAAAVSKTWARLDLKYHLVSRDRRGKLAKVTSLREDGSGRRYDYPAGDSSADRYLKLPYAYWTAEQRWYRELSLPGKAMLLVALSLPPGFALPTERAPGWYGISADTADRGLRELARHGLLERSLTVKKAPQAPLGYAQEYRHTLQPPFARRRARATVTRLRSAS